MTSLIRTDIFVDNSPIHGRGVFANQYFNPGDIIEECHVFTVHKTETCVYEYTFLLASNYTHEKRIGFVLGFGSLYNHADQPNATYVYDEARSLIRFSALTTIRPGEEILTNYGEFWFSVRNTLPIKPSWLYRCRIFLRKHRPILRWLLIVIAATQLYILNQ